jgi:hypothetical protein
VPFSSLAFYPIGIIMLLALAIRAYLLIPSFFQPSCSCGRPIGADCSAIALELTQRLGSRRALPIVASLMTRCLHREREPLFAPVAVSNRIEVFC